jgi:hypothetical protein
VLVLIVTNSFLKNTTPRSLIFRFQILGGMADTNNV